MLLYTPQCVLMFADVQIFTSLAILIGAYASVGCDIVAYHWQYMIYLAWLASITHLASLSFLRNHLANNPAKRTWRLVAMCIIQVMLSVAVGLSMTLTEDNGDAYKDSSEGPYEDPWLNHGGRPAVCYFKEGIKADSVTFQSAIKLIVLLVWGFAVRIAKTFRGFEGGLRETASRLEQRGNKHRRGGLGSMGREWDHTFADASIPRRVWGYFFVPIQIGFYSVLSIQLDLFTSLLAEVCCVATETSSEELWLISFDRSIGYSLLSSGLRRASLNSEYQAIKTTANGLLVRFFLSSFSLPPLPRQSKPSIRYQRATSWLATPRRFLCLTQTTPET